MNNLEYAKQYIENEIRERGLKNDQIEINFSDICEEKEVVEAAKQLGYEADNENCTEGTWWIYK